MRPRLPPLPHPRQYTPSQLAHYLEHQLLAYSSTNPNLTHTDMSKNRSEHRYEGWLCWGLISHDPELTIRKVHLLTPSAYRAWNAWNKDALILCSLLNLPDDHIARIKAVWQHPLHPSMTLEAQRACRARFFSSKAHRRCGNASRPSPTMSFHHNRRMQHAPVPLSSHEQKKRMYLSCQVRMSGFSPDPDHWDRRELEDGRRHRPGAPLAQPREMQPCRRGRQRSTRRRGWLTVGDGLRERRAEGRFHGGGEGTPNVVRGVWGPLLVCHTAPLEATCFTGSRLLVPTVKQSTVRAVRRGCSNTQTWAQSCGPVLVSDWHTETHF